MEEETLEQPTATAVADDQGRPPLPAADDAAVDEALGSLAESAQNFEDRKKGTKSKDGDQVVIDFAAEGEEGRIPEEDYRRMAVVIGGSGFEELEKLVTGLEAGKKKSKKLAFPEGFREAELAGMYDRGLRISQLESGAKKVTLSEPDLVSQTGPGRSPDLHPGCRS